MRRYILIILFAVLCGVAILMITGCAAVQTREVYLLAGEKIKITTPTQLKVWINEDGSFTVESKDYVLGENLIIR